MAPSISRQHDNVVAVNVDTDHPNFGRPRHGMDCVMHLEPGTVFHDGFQFLRITGELYGSDGQLHRCLSTDGITLSACDRADMPVYQTLPLITRTFGI